MALSDPDSETEFIYCPWKGAEGHGFSKIFDSGPETRSRNPSLDPVSNRDGLGVEQSWSSVLRFLADRGSALIALGTEAFAVFAAALGAPWSVGAPDNYNFDSDLDPDKCCSVVCCTCTSALAARCGDSGG